jgi:hypothetical protein
VFDNEISLMLLPFSGNGRHSIILSAARWVPLLTSFAEGTLDQCIRQFTSKPMSQLHLFEIHTAEQGGIDPAVFSAKQIIELASLRNFL